MRDRLLILILAVCAQSYSQTDSTSNLPLNAVNTIIEKTDDKRLSIGAYGQVEFTQQFADTAKHNALIDVHRLVLFMGYKFNDRTHFITEIEFEHVNEAAIEQAFLNYRIKKWLDLRAGLILIPMGIINEYHEPTTFNGVTRPNIDKNIVPATWRELGAGFNGKFDKIALKYQLYAVNGFLGYDGTGRFKGSDGIRGGRQKGIKSVMTTPDLSLKADYYGIPGLTIGVAGYFGESESTLYNGLWKEDTLQNAQSKFDSSVVGISMIGADMRYHWKGLEARGQYILCKLDNAEKYNKLTGKDLGSEMSGFYLEAGYNMLECCKKTKNKLILFARYEDYNTHAKTSSGITLNKSYHRTEITTGLGFKVADGAVFKADLQHTRTDSDNDVPKNFLNLGFGIWF